MANDVFANNREISCKKADGKSISAFPDVCFTPPENPATPPGTPVPYPNTGMARDTTNGSRSVKISRKEIMLKNKSYFKKSVGDEAGSAAKKGAVTSVNRGKVYFNAWSMDVKVEGENVVRHLDITTHNHASATGQTPPIPYADRMSLVKIKECDAQREKIHDACDPWEEKAKCPSSAGIDAAKAAQSDVQANFPARSSERANAQAIVDMALEQFATEIQENECQRALRCALTTHDAGKAGACCPPQTPEHLIPASQFGPGRGKDHAKYKAGKAACMCAEGGSNAATHGLLGRERRAYMEDRGITPGKDTWTVGASAKCGAASAYRVERQCDPACIEAQLLENHKREMDIDAGDPIGTVQNDDGQNLSGFAAEYIGGTP